ncbi:hypothetical protein JAAARDRAFT_33240 [Jaapia argillacea MUCL 33604]|uniref:ER membrane protein complex subunit 4 n=1 Tax=Jaapia argillacea MUCL 33604 TaxID=933084 RepID=A0A067Q0J0_9AGAM|nr:hypothetical protein JAAARDRAFT_33240 [Jaapia argillacea MUCL 33604]
MSTTLELSSLENTRWRNLTPPPGFSDSASTSKAPEKASAHAIASYEKMKDKRAWDVALAPAKSLPMQGFMLYMSGGGVQIFSMGIVFMLLLNPFKNMAAVNTAFAPFAPANSKPNALTTLPLQKLGYLVCNLLTLALGLWKCRQMGLLPTGTGDWLAFESRGMAPELFLM